MRYNRLLLLLHVVLAGCTVGPEYVPPTPAMPCEWHTVSDEMQANSPDNFVWWEALNDPQLNELLEKAALQNLDLEIAALRILEARTMLKGGKAQNYPHVDASANCGHVQYDKHALNHVLGTDAKSHFDFFEVGFDAEWEIDLFGKNTHDTNALKAQLEASEESYRDVWITLSAEVARNYIELRSQQQSLERLNKNIDAQNETFTLTKDLSHTGFESSIDQQTAQEQLHVLTAQKPQIELAIKRAIHRLSILLGYAPGALYDELCAATPLPQVPCQKPIGIPSELLRRRPDIRKAERDLAAATERVGSAIAAMFPRISLNGFLGDLGTFGSGGGAWYVGPQLLLPIFNSRLLEQDVNINKIQTRQALLEYQKIVLAALEETENAIAAFHYEMQRNHELSQALQASQDANQLTLQLYQTGITSYLDVLVGTRSLLAIQEAYQESQTAMLIEYIALYKALGGDWTISCP